MLSFSSIKTIYNRLRHTGPALIDQALISGSNFVIGLLLARWLGVEAFGQFAILWLVINFAVDIHRAVIVIPLMALFPKFKDQIKAYTKRCLGLHWMLLAILCAGISGFILVTEMVLPQWRISQYWLLAGGLVVTRLAHEMYRRLFFVKDTPVKALVLDIIYIVILSSGLIYAVYIDDITITSVLLAYITAYGIGGGVGAVINLWGASPKYNTQSNDEPVKPLSLIDVIHHHWHSARWLIANISVQYASSNYFILAAAAILGPIAAGYVRIAQYLLGPVNIMLQGLDNILPIKAAQIYHDNGLRDMYQYLKSLTVIFLVGTALYGAVLFPNTAWILDVGFDIQNTQATHLAWGFIVYALLLVVSFGQMFYLRTMEHTRPLFTASCITALFSIIASYWMINAYGILGVIFGMLIMRIFVIFWLGRSIQHSLKVV